MTKLSALLAAEILDLSQNARHLYFVVDGVVYRGGQPLTAPIHVAARKGEVGRA